MFILASGAGGTPFQQLSNAAASTLYGAEAELAWAPSQGLLLQLGAGSTHSNFDEFNSQIGGDLSGNELPSAPTLNFNVLPRYEWPALGGTLAVQADGKYSTTSTSTSTTIRCSPRMRTAWSMRGVSYTTAAAT